MNQFVKKEVHGCLTELVANNWEVTKVSESNTQIKVWPDGKSRPPRYFTVKVTENL